MRTRTAPALALLLVLVPACGGSDDPVAATTPSPTTSPSGDRDDQEWCAAERAVREASLAMDVVDPTDPEALAHAMALMIERAELAAPLAPDEIAADVVASLDRMQQFDTALADADYDFVRADFSAVMNGPDLSDAESRIAAYNAEFCGIEPLDAGTDGDVGDDGDDGGETAFDPADGSLRDQSIAFLLEQGFTDAEAACLSDNIGLGGPDLATDETKLLELVETCDLDVERLSELLG